MISEHAAKCFKEGDPIIVFEDMSNKKLVFLKKDAILQNKFGAFSHNNIIGQTSGSKVFNQKNNQYVIVLTPTPSLITETLAHKTQILYEMDIALIISKLNITPGCIVVESGTGSCSLSYSLATTIQSSGHLYTFEFNKDRFENAQEFFTKSNLTQVTVTHRDVCSLGFLPLPNETKYNLSLCDAVFLDLPKPWEAIPHAKACMKIGAKICCFSPCIEQVQKTHELLRKEGFIDLIMLESLCRRLERKERTKEIEKGFKRKHAEIEKNEKKVFYTLGSTNIKGHTGYLSFATLFNKK